MSFPDDWKRYREITITNNGAALTDYQLRIVLNTRNFDFAKADASGKDLRFSEAPFTTELPYWVEKYDYPNEAVIWIKLNIPANTTKTIRLYYGNPAAADASDGASVFIYYNELSNSTELADLAAIFNAGAAASWSIVSDSGAESGSAVDASISAGGYWRSKPVTNLPVYYVAEVDVKQTSGSDYMSYIAPVLLMQDDDNLYRPSFLAYGAATTADDTHGANIMRRITGTPNDHWGTVYTKYVGVPNNEWTTNRAYAKRRRVFNYTSTLPMHPSEYQQGVSVDEATGDIYVSYSEAVRRYSSGGTLLDSYIGAPATGKTWGGCFYKDGTLYVEGAGQKIHSFSATDLAAGFSVVLDEAGTNRKFDGITHDGTYWILGESNKDTTHSTYRIYIYDNSWSLIKELVVPIPQDEQYGIQGLTVKDNFLYATYHYGMCVVYAWDNSTLSIQLVDVIPAIQTDLQGIYWDTTNSRFVLCNRLGYELWFGNFEDHSSNTIVFNDCHNDTHGHTINFRYEDESFQRNRVGIIGYRSGRFSRLRYRQYVLDVPKALVGAEVLVTTKILMCPDYRLLKEPMLLNARWTKNARNRRAPHGYRRVRIDKSHPIAAGLVACFPLSLDDPHAELVANERLSFSDPSRVSSRYYGVRITNTSVVSTSKRQRFNLLGDVSCIAQFIPVNTSSGHPLLTIETGSGETQQENIAFGLWIMASGVLSYIHEYGNGSNAVVDLFNIVPYGHYTVAVQRDIATQTIYWSLNNGPVNSASYSEPNPDANDPGGNIIGICSRTDGAQFLDARIRDVVIWDRKVPFADMYNWSDFLIST